MIPVTAVDQVLNGVQEVKARAKAFRTNLYAPPARLQDWINRGEMLQIPGERTCFFVRRDRDFYHLFFCAPDPTTLAQELTRLHVLASEPLAVDVVGGEPALAELLQVLESAGLRRYARLLRLIRGAQTATPPATGEGARIEPAGPADGQAVGQLLESCFDRFADQLPLPHEIEAALATGQVLVVKFQGTIAALLFLETQGFTSTVRYWAVAEGYRSHGFGSALIRHYFASHPKVRRFILWVRADNENAVQKYRHYDYLPDGLVDYVLVNKVIRT
jgi:ribosomal protein S18 acetylase RimI-like enzyme